jgi:hypothetical protein
VIFGSVMGSFASKIRHATPERLTFDEILDRYRAIKALTHFEDL